MSKISLEPNASGAGTFSIVSPDSNTNRTLTLPDASGSIVAADASTGRFDSSNMPAGSVIQVVSTTKTDRFAATLDAGTNIEIPGLEQSITPVSESSNILIVAQVAVFGTRSSIGIVLKRGSNFIARGDSGLDNQQTAGGWTGANTDSGFTTMFNHLDTPATTANITYKINVANLRTASNTITVGQFSGENVRTASGISTITLMEIAG